jgi:hypothetical protein
VKARISAGAALSESSTLLSGIKHHAVSWALRLQRVVLQGSFASLALLYFRVKLSTLGPLLQGSGAVIKGSFSGRALRLRVFLLN